MSEHARRGRFKRSYSVFYTTDNGAWQDVYPDAGYTPWLSERTARVAYAQRTAQDMPPNG